MTDEIEKGHLFRDKLVEAQTSPFRTYMDLTVGDEGVAHFALYEFLTSFLGPLPGGLGFLLRKKLYRRLFRHCGGGLIIGRNVVIRHGKRIELMNGVTIDDNSLIDARGAGDAGLDFDKKKKKNPLIYVGIGCLVLFLLAVVGGGACTLLRMFVF